MISTPKTSATPPATLPPQALLQATGLTKGFTLHIQGGIHLPVLKGVSLTLNPGECVALVGASGSGKSTFMRALYGNYRVDGGDIWVRQDQTWVNLPQLQDHELLAVRRHTIGYVSQFLRVIPRVSAVDVAAEPLLELGMAPGEARERVCQLLRRLNLPERLWSLSPTTFSGGEKQRVNIARAFAAPYPILLLDEPTSALDGANREVVVELIAERQGQGHAMVGIFHDEDVRDRICNRSLMFGCQTTTTAGG